MNLNTEIRNLSPGNLYNLVQILEQDESWKKLMAIIPKTLTLENFDCKITIHNLPKYNTDHFKLIDSAGYKQRRPCAEILFEEWGTSGRIRPRLGHLITLLKKTELFRAADFIAMELLKMPEVDRPTAGPAAKINIPKDEHLNNYIPHHESIKYPSSFLEGEAIPSSIISELMNPRPEHVIPEIRIIGVGETYEQTMKKVENAQQKYVSNNNIPKFSSLLEMENSSSPIINISSNENSDSNNLPAISVLNSNSSNSAVSNSTEITDVSSNNSDSNNLPGFSNIVNNSTNFDSNRNVMNSQNDYRPAISNLLNESPSKKHVSFSEDLPAFSQILEDDNQNFTPNFSDIMSSKTENIKNQTKELPAFSQILDSDQIDQNLPAFSQMLDSIQSSQNLPAFSQFDILQKNNPNNEMSQNQEVNQNIPAFSQMLDNIESSHNLPVFSNFDIKQEYSPNNEMSLNYSPAFSQIFDKISQNSKKSSPNFSLHNEIPAFSQLNISPATSTASSTEMQEPKLDIQIPDLNLLHSSPANSVHSNSSRTCVSPLPNLLLNTILPHFTYQELEICTQNFDESLLSMQESTNLNQAARFGRKLGSGAFGSVYLGIGLLDKPVAVKKLNLNGVVVVNVDDTITKQFKNEVELLCKYKHENLLSLLGYSCDGPTYCLIYEYICGGALKDRLHSSLKSPELFRLLWTDRLYIALGTAQAVAYLHNAYSMPLIHRDIKSANILLDGTNKPKLCDFGLIKLTPNPNTNTGTTVFGTSAYMAPEAFRGDVSVKLDTFSFGVVLLELLTSLPPLDESREGNDLITHIEEICEDDIKPLLDMNAGSWLVKDTHFGNEIYKIANQCLEEKKRRPVMTTVVNQLTELIIKSVP